MLNHVKWNTKNHKRTFQNFRIKPKHFRRVLYGLPGERTVLDLPGIQLGSLNERPQRISRATMKAYSGYTLHKESGERITRKTERCAKSIPRAATSVAKSAPEVAGASIASCSVKSSRIYENPTT